MAGYLHCGSGDPFSVRDGLILASVVEPEETDRLQVFLSGKESDHESHHQTLQAQPHALSQHQNHEEAGYRPGLQTPQPISRVSLHCLSQVYRGGHQAFPPSQGKCHLHICHRK